MSLEYITRALNGESARPSHLSVLKHGGLMCNLMWLLENTCEKQLPAVCAASVLSEVRGNPKLSHTDLSPVGFSPDAFSV